jgi:competence protein CoiA
MWKALSGANTQGGTGIMELAIVNGERQRARPKLSGNCPICGDRMVSKCGTKILWHWAHYGRKHCDPWWENETEWHRSWKACFPEEWREQVHFDEKGEKHIADVKTPSGTVLEFQNSAMPAQELAVREHFYGKLLWIVNGAPFISHFFVLGRMPSPDAQWARDFVFIRQQQDMRGRCFWRKSENPGYNPGELVLLHSMTEIQDKIDEDYVGHHLYDWVRPRSVWFEARLSVYIDFGGDLLWHMQRYDDRGLQCVQAIRKSTLVSLHGGNCSDTGEITRVAKRSRRIGDAVAQGEDEVILHQIR